MNTDTDHMHCCTSGELYCPKNGACVEDYNEECCPRLCPARFGQGEDFCASDMDVPNKDEKDCCHLIEEVWRECETALTDVDADSIYDDAGRALMISRRDAGVTAGGNCRNIEVETVHCCNEPHEYWCTLKPGCVSVDKDCCENECEFSFYIPMPPFSTPWEL